MKLFTIGPTEMYQTTKDIRQANIPYFRTNEFSQDVLELDALLKKQMKTTANSKTVYLTASGTAAMEALLINCFGTQDRLLIIEGGSFGNRFGQICNIHGLPHDSISLDWDEELTSEHFAKYEKETYSALIVNLHETSTGQLYDINLLKEFCDRKGILLFVDAISTFLCDKYEMDAWGIDATIISTQKGLCVSPGMAMVVLNEKACEKVDAMPVKSLYFDFKDYFANIKRGQTPFTPAVGIVYEVLDMLRSIEKIGLDNRLKYIADLAETYRGIIKGNGINIPNFKMSNAITTTCFAKPVANEICAELRKLDDIFVNPSGGEYGRYNFRVSHVGDLTKEDTVLLGEKIKSLYAKYK